MKKIFLFLVAFSALLLFSCTKANDTTIEEHEVYITAKKPILTSETKTILINDTPYWHRDDLLSVYWIDGNGVKKNTQFSPVGGTFGPSDIYKEDVTFRGSISGTSRAFAFYPQNKNDITSEGYATVSFPETQSPGDGTFDGAADVMVSKEIPTLDGENVNVQFKRLGAILKVVLNDKNNDLNDGEKLINLTITSSQNLTGVAYLDFESQSIVDWDAPQGGHTRSTSVKGTNLSSSVDGENAVYLVVYPQVLAAGSSLVISGETSSHTFERTISSLSKDLILAESAITTLKSSLGTVTAKAATTYTATYTWTGTQSTVSLTSSGDIPDGSTIATATNGGGQDITQMSAGNSQLVRLNGYDGYIIKKISLSMHSNSSRGKGSFYAKVGSTTISEIGSTTEGVDFSDALWNGGFTTSWVNIIPAITSEPVVGTGEQVELCIKCITTNSLYCQSYTIEYEEDTPLGNLESISLSGNYPTTFTKGDAFSHSGIIVTAHFSSGKIKDVTSSAHFSSPNMNMLGVQTVTVEYTSVDETTKSTTYNITINDIPRYTVILSDTSEELTSGDDGNVTLPSRSVSVTDAFVGWSTTNVTTATETRPTIIQAGTYRPTSDITLYPVYSYSTAGGSSKYVNVTTLTQGKTYVFGAVKAAKSATLKNNTPIAAVTFTSTSSWGSYVTYTPDTNGELTTSTVTNNNAKWELVSKTGSGASTAYTFKCGNNYLSLGTSTGASTVGVSSTTTNVYLEDVNSTCKNAFLMHPTSSNTNKLLCNTGNNFGYRMYASSTNDSASMCPFIRFYELQSGTVTKYIGSDTK